MANAFRLKSVSMFDRKEEEMQEEPSRIAFLSVEGNKTEKQYFEYVNKYRTQLGIKSIVQIHPLSRDKKDNLCAPSDVVELLDEYIELRNADVLPERMRLLIPQVYSNEFIQKYLNGDYVDPIQKKGFEEVLQQSGIDLAYHYFLHNISGENDIFGIVIDRDHGNHSITQLNNIVQECNDKGYHCFISTPLIEFWLLLHLADVKADYADQLEDFRKNITVSQQHTFTSREVSRLASHKKSISEKIFVDKYLPKIDYAIEQTRKNFSTELSELIGTDESEDLKKGKLGSNLPHLFDMLRNM